MNSCVTFKHLVRFGSESSQRPLCVGHPDTIWPIVIIPSDLGRDILLSWYHPTNMWLFSKETLTILTANIMSIFTADCPKYWHLHHTFFFLHRTVPTLFSVSANPSVKRKHEQPHIHCATKMASSLVGRPVIGISGTRASPCGAVVVLMLKMSYRDWIYYSGKI